MFREMRRKDRALSEENLEAILKEGEYGVLGTLSDDGYPYVVPLSYVYEKNRIYFHCATSGLKLDNILRTDKVSFTVVDHVVALPKEFSTRYQSAVIFGTAEILEGEEKDSALSALIRKYSSEFTEEGSIYIDRAKGSTTVVAINIQHKTGKGRL